MLIDSRLWCNFSYVENLEIFLLIREEKREKRKERREKREEKRVEKREKRKERREKRKDI
jgi:hypothetical protein